MLHQIGAGALGPVFRAYQPEPGRLVAVKLFRLDLPPQLAHVLVAEFTQLIAADLSHPGIAAPIGTGLYEVTPYLAQDFVTADSLDVVIRTGGSSSPDEVARVAAQVGAALDFAAEKGVLHGALHPRDVMLSADDVRITGFGVARALENVQVRTPVRRPYSPPERAVGGPWDGRADMFSFAALMFELLFLRRVSGSGDRAVASLPEVPGVSRNALKRVFAKALSADPAGRFQSGVAFAEALQDALSKQDSDTSRQSPRLPLEMGAAAAVDAASPDEAPVEHDTMRLVPVDDSGTPVDELSVAESVDFDLQERQLHEEAATITAEAQQSQEVASHTPKRRRKTSADRRASLSRDQAEAADVVRAENIVVPPVFTGSPAEETIDEVVPAEIVEPFVEPVIEPSVVHAVDAADLEQVESAAHGIEAWLEEHEPPRRPGGASDVPPSDVASHGHEHEPLDLHAAPHGTLFDDHPLDLRESSELPDHDVAAVHADIATPVDHDLTLSGREEEERGNGAVAFASMALETTRTAIWPLVLSFVVGGAIVLGVVALWYEGRGASGDASAPVAAIAPPPTQIEDPPILPEPATPSAAPRLAAPAPANAITPEAPVVSEPIAPAAPRNQPPTPAARPAPVERPRPQVERAPSRTAPTARGNAAREARPAPPARSPAPAARRPAAPAVAPVPSVGSLRVESRPAGATVVLDGRRVGATPLTLNNLEAGDHPVAIELQGFRRWATSVKIIGGQQVRVGASLEE